MANEIRLLDPSNENDQRMLSNVLDHLLAYEQSSVAAERTIERWNENVNFIKSRFTVENSNAMYIAGNIVDNEIIDLSVGCKWILFNREKFRPEWIHILIYTRDKNIKSPRDKIRETGSHVVQRMEADGYYHFWQCMRFPNIKTDEGCKTYIEKHWDKKLDMSRYINILECVLLRGQDISTVPVFFRRFFEGLTGNKSMCVTSHHTKAEYRTFIKND